jgi:hypothetical protein
LICRPARPHAGNGHHACRPRPVTAASTGPIGWNASWTVGSVYRENLIGRIGLTLLGFSPHGPGQLSSRPDRPHVPPHDRRRPADFPQHRPQLRHWLGTDFIGGTSSASCWPVRASPSWWVFRRRHEHPVRHHHRHGGRLRGRRTDTAAHAPGGHDHGHAHLAGGADSVGPVRPAQHLGHRADDCPVPVARRRG